MVQWFASKVTIKLETDEVATGGLPKDLDDSKKSVSVHLRFAAIVNRTGRLQFLPAFNIYLFCNILQLNIFEFLTGIGDRIEGIRACLEARFSEIMAA